MGLSKTSSTAVNLLIDIGYFPVHVNLDLLKYNINTEQSDEVLLAAEILLTAATDIDEVELYLHVYSFSIFVIRFFPTFP